MLRTALATTLGLLALLTGVTLAGRTSDAKVEWHRNLDAATELARETGRPLLIVFR